MFAVSDGVLAQSAGPRRLSEMIRRVEAATLEHFAAGQAVEQAIPEEPAQRRTRRMRPGRLVASVRAARQRDHRVPVVEARIGHTAAEAVRRQRTERRIVRRRHAHTGHQKRIGGRGERIREQRRKQGRRRADGDRDDGLHERGERRALIGVELPVVRKGESVGIISPGKDGHSYLRVGAGHSERMVSSGSTCAARRAGR